ncbi:MAP7 domain-containing protein 2-like isoform X3 [Girardinichthys multiradiatus]|uniref:MAP7 domain-containing protein 2-like isoform X3 n=1 Tax=Girardinichthys multiradiatus TaxID=208333 RepID=UPI001FAC88C2|nr:MAP7 domain-containing protein 2-like isoform X3 [Girardinichthys multiradiatus]
MAQVVQTRVDMTALVPPPAPLHSRRQASPAQSPSSPTGSRLNLSKERQEDRQKTQELSLVLQDKERRAQQQLERCAEERGRKLEQQRRKEQQRRAAAEEKRRLQKDAEKERLEALVRRRAGGADRRGGGGSGAGEARDHLDNRPKRWTWGGPPDGVEGNPKTPPCHAIGSAQPNELPAASSASQSRHVVDFLSPPTMDEPNNKQLSNSSGALSSPERVSSVSRRTASPNNNQSFRSPSNRRSIAGFPEETSKAKTPTGETPNTPVRSSSFKANSKGHAASKRVRSNRSRAQSPCSPGQYPPSPLRQRATTPGSDDNKGHSTLERKTAKSEASDNKKITKSSSRELNAESPGTPTGRSVGGTTDAEEASRLLAERRRLARIQKEQEERQRQEEERLKAEEEQRRQQEARERQERAAQQAEEERARKEEERRTREEEDRRQKEQRWKNMQDQLDREREEAFLRAQREAERKRQERELLHIQEEQERQQRKKRIEEIMKRTRKSEVEPPSAASAGEVKAEAAEEAGASEEDAATPAEAPIIMLGPLENKSFVDELSDGVQSMDVSPVSRDEQASAQEFSPVADGPDGYPPDHLMDLDGPGRGQRQGAETPPYPRLQAGSGVGDLNKNLLIQAYSATSETPQLIHSVGPGKLDV